jgi:hypothetical protein
MSIPLIQHRLPSQPGDTDTTWFTHRQNAFEQAAILQQVAFKRAKWPDLPDGPFSKQPQHTYPHILPQCAEQLAFYDGFVLDVLTYMHANNIAVHTEALNLKSSQVACLNFLFPLKKDLSLASMVLRKLDAFPGLTSVENIEFEYTGQDETNRKEQPCTAWLGEPRSGKRGQHRTSIDAAVFWTDQRGKTHISLIEWKYTERNFGSCSAFANADAETKTRCRSLTVTTDPADHCVLAGSGRHCGRHYWDHMQEAGISLAKLAVISGCPFQGPFYQLMRQFLIAQYLRTDGHAHHVAVLAVEFEGNDALRAVPPQLRPLMTRPESTVIDTWNSIVDGVPPLCRITAEKLLAAYDSTPATDPTWRQYITARYGL